jgi:ABC-type amino acid transport substrate-binding protein
LPWEERAGRSRKVFDAEETMAASLPAMDFIIEGMQKRGEIGIVKVYLFDRIEEAMTDLEAGRITAVMKVAPVAAWLAAKSPDLRIVAQVPDDPQPLGIGFGKNEPALLAAVNGALVAMQRDRSMDRLKNKWGVP